MSSTLVFYAIATVLTLLVVGWLVRPLLRHAPDSDVTAERLNAAIYRDQLAALERDLASGGMTPADYETIRDELQLRLLDDTRADAPGATAPVSASPVAGFLSARRTAALMTVVLVVGAAGGYYQLGGGPDAIDPVAAQSMGSTEVKKMVEGLAARMKANPGDVKGWAMLVRSYKVMGMFDEAEQAVRDAGPLLETSADLLTQYADLLASRNNNNLEGKPLALVNKALVLNPRHPVALMLAGTAAFQRADYMAAVGHWEKVLTVLDPASPDATQVKQEIADARARAALSGSRK